MAKQNPEMSLNAILLCCKQPSLYPVQDLLQEEPLRGVFQGKLLAKQRQHRLYYYYSGHVSTHIGLRLACGGTHHISIISYEGDMNLPERAR